MQNYAAANAIGQGIDNIVI